MSKREYCPKCHSALKIVVSKTELLKNFICTNGDCEYERTEALAEMLKTPIAEAVVKELAAPKKIKLDIGCGPNSKEGFVGIDSIDFGNNYVTNIGEPIWVLQKPIDNVTDRAVHTIDTVWKFKNDCVEEASCSHVLEHLTNFNDKWERVNFWNELYRIMAKDSKLSLVIPHWNSNRFYGDPTHKEPWSEMSFYYLDKKWRATNAPHTDLSRNVNGYNCDWQFTFGYSMHSSLINRNSDYQQFGMTHYREACQDIIATLTPVKE